MTDTHAAFSAFDAAAILISLAAALGYVNHRWLGLPSSVGLTAMGALAALAVTVLDFLLPSVSLSSKVATFLDSVDFHTVLLDGMLSFLLFAGALHVDWNEMNRGRWPILLLSTVGVLISTAVIGLGFFLTTQLLSLPISLLWCMVFGALISPTDPVAVMAIMKRASLPGTLQATVAGESLFNDGVGVVVFSILLTAAASAAPISVQAAGLSFVVEAGGGAILGSVVGWLGFKAMQSIDEYNVELMITLALVMGGYTLAHWLHVSGPVAMAVAGLLIGNAGVSLAMSETCRDHVLKFWALVDELLNALLFLLIGLELIAISVSARLLLVGAVAIPLVLVARLTSVWIPLRLLRSRLPFGREALPTLTWGGLRGGISIALALSLPEGPARTIILAITYCVVLFSVLVLGASIKRLLKLPPRSAEERC